MKMTELIEIVRDYVHARIEGGASSDTLWTVSAEFKSNQREDRLCVEIWVDECVTIGAPTCQAAADDLLGRAHHHDLDAATVEEITALWRAER